jgi:hypothetical protein
MNSSPNKKQELERKARAKYDEACKNAKENCSNEVREANDYVEQTIKEERSIVNAAKDKVNHASDRVEKKFRQQDFEAAVKAANAHVNEVKEDAKKRIQYAKQTEQSELNEAKRIYLEELEQIKNNDFFDDEFDLEESERSEDETAVINESEDIDLRLEESDDLADMEDNLSLKDISDDLNNIDIEEIPSFEISEETTDSDMAPLDTTLDVSDDELIENNTQEEVKPVPAYIPEQKEDRNDLISFRITITNPERPYTNQTVAYIRSWPELKSILTIGNSSLLTLICRTAGTVDVLGRLYELPTVNDVSIEKGCYFVRQKF